MTTTFHDQAAAIGESLRDLRHELNQAKDRDIREHLELTIMALEDARETIRRLSSFAEIFAVKQQ